MCTLGVQGCPGGLRRFQGGFKDVWFGQLVGSSKSGKPRGEN